MVRGIDVFAVRISREILRLDLEREHPAHLAKIARPGLLPQKHAVKMWPNN